MRDIIRIHPRNQFTARACQSRIGRGRHARMVLRHDPHPRIVAGPAVEDLARSIRRTVVHGDEFPVGPSLRANALHGARYGGGGIEYRQYDGNARHGFTSIRVEPRMDKPAQEPFTRIA